MTEADGAAQRAGPPALADAVLRVVALGGISEIGRNMTVFEYRPDRTAAGCSSSTAACCSARPTRPASTSPCPTGRTSATGSTTSTPSCSPTATRTTSARCPTCCANAADIPLIGSRLTLALVVRQARSAPDPAAAAPGRRGRDDDRRAMGSASSSRSTTRSRTRWRWRSGSASTPCCTPATSRWTRRRWTAGSPTCPASPGSATRASTCCWPTRPTPRCPASSRPSAMSARSSPT